MYPDGFEDFAELLKRTWPGMEIERPQRVGAFGDHLAMFCIEERIPRELYWAGFGFQIWCQLLTHITRSRKDSILLIDEPEIYLHPDVQRQLLGVLRECGPDVVIATHSAEIMGEADPSEIVVIDKTKQSGERLKTFKGVQSALNVLGSVQNITLTQLARNRRILFVESLDDFRIIRRFANKLGFPGVSSGLNVTPVESGGFGNWEKLPGLAWGIEKALGTPLRLGAVFDRDYFCTEEIEEILNRLGKGFELAHFHGRKEIENYLLAPTVLERALAKAIYERQLRSGKLTPSGYPTAIILEQITNKFRADVLGQFIAKRNAFFKNAKRDPATLTTETVQEFDLKWGNLDQRMSIVPGKETLKLFREYAQTEHSVSLTDYRIIDEFRREEVPKEMQYLVERLEQFRHGSVTSPHLPGVAPLT